MKIIHKYVLREHVGPLVFALSALTSLMLLNYIAKQFGNLVGKGLPAGVIGEFFLLSVPFTVAMTLPMSVLVATLYAFSRLAAENEVMALKANGVSMKRVLVPVVLAATALSVGMIAFTDQVLSAANHRLRTLQGDIARKKPTFGLREQIINEVIPGRFFLRASHVDPATNRLRDVTIYDLSNPTRRRSIYADSGELAFAENGNDLLLTLQQGYILEVPRDTPMRLQRLHFVTDLILVEDVANQLETTTADSYKSDREMSICELQNEVSRYEVELEQARTDLRRALLAVTREAISGRPAPPAELSPPSVFNTRPGSLAPRSKNFSIGRLYCDFTRSLRSLKTAVPVPTLRPAHAADLSMLAQGGAADSARRADSIAAARQDSARRLANSMALLRDSAARAARLPVVAESLPQPVPVPGAPGLAERSYRTIAQPPMMLAGLIENARARMFDNRQQINRNAVELHKKFAISVACLVFVLVGAPIALRFPRGGVGLVIGVSLVIFGIYYVGLIAGEALADRGLLTPFWAMWSANIILTLFAAVLLGRMGRETATARGGDISELLEVIRAPFRRRRSRSAVRPA